MSVCIGGGWKFSCYLGRGCGQLTRGVINMEKHLTFLLRRTSTVTFADFMCTLVTLETSLPYHTLLLTLLMLLQVF